MRVHSLRWRLYWGARERLRDAVSRLTLPLANWYDARHPDVCRADIIPDLGLAYDLGRVLREGMDTFRGEAKRCVEDAERDGMCWCGKHVCKRRMAELAATTFRDDSATTPEGHEDATSDAASINAAISRLQDTIERARRAAAAGDLHGALDALEGKK